MSRTVKGVIVVLGFSNDERGCLTSVARERCARAFEEFRKKPGYSVLPTGGWGQHFNLTDKPHGVYLRQDLADRGIPDSAFLGRVESSNTIEDAALARPILDACPDAELIVVTSDFHEARARFLFEREFPERTIALSTSVTDLAPDEIERLRAHEEQALGKLRAQENVGKNR